MTYQNSAAAQAAALIALVVALSGMVIGPQVNAQQIKGSYETTAEVPLREGPGNFHKVVTTLPKGIQINVVGKEGYWLKVESKHGDKPGYVDEQFARPATAATATAAAPAAPSPFARSPAPIARCARSTCVKHPVPILESSPVSRRTSKSTSSAPRAIG